MVADKAYKATHTTPDSMTINKYLNEMNAEGVEFCFMEVSSHGIHQYRTEGLVFEGGIFYQFYHMIIWTIITPLPNIGMSKNLSLTTCQKSAFALVNVDDKNGLVMLQNTPARKYTYALKTYANLQGRRSLKNQNERVVVKDQ